MNSTKTIEKVSRITAQTLTSRFLAYLPEPGISNGSLTARLSRYAESVGLTIRRSDPFFFACALPQSMNNQEKGISEDETVLDVFPGTAASKRSFNVPSGRWDWEAWHKMASREAQCYNLFRLTDEGMEWQSDPLSLKPFYQAEVQGGTLLGSRITDLVHLFPELIKPLDETSVYGFLIMNAFPSDRTLHAKIRRAPTGAVYRWTPREGLSVTRERRLKAPPVNANGDVKEMVMQIREAMERSLFERIQNAALPPVLSLSGGFDSRLIAAMVCRRGLPLKAYTYGNPHHHEVWVAKQIAKLLGLDHTLLPYRENNLLERLPIHLDLLEGHADLGVVQVANTFQIESPAGTPLLHGLLGETLAGNVAWPEEKEYENPDTFARAIIREYSRKVVFEGLPWLEEERMEEAQRKDIKSYLQQDHPSYQAMMLWDLEYHQRRDGGAYIGLVANHFDVMAPNYDLEVMKAWLSVPRIALEKRSFFRELLAREFPELAKIPHPTEMHPILPNLKRQLAFYLEGKWSRLRMRLLGKHPNIELLWCVLTPGQRQTMLSEIGSLREVAEDGLGLKMPEDVKMLEKSHPQIVRNLFLMTRYAAWILNGNKAEEVRV